MSDLELNSNLHLLEFLKKLVLYNICNSGWKAPELEGPAGDDVLHQDSVTLHEHSLWHQVDGQSLQLPDLHVHCAQLNTVIFNIIFNVMSIYTIGIVCVSHFFHFLFSLSIKFK